MNAIPGSFVEGRTESVGTFVKKERRWFFFKVTNWVLVKEDRIADDIVVQTERPIRAVILNGKEIIIPS